MQSFFRVYGTKIPCSTGRSRILDVGSKVYEGQDTYKSIIDDGRFQYIGLDLEPGRNVDIVPATPYVWPEIADETIDACISGQTFEHNPFFWATFAEMARVLTLGGYLCLIAPGGGPVHRYPMDCWRFYPDAWSALCALTGLELVETYWEPDSVEFEMQDWAQWRDTMLIARKPELSGAAAAEINERRRQLVEPFRNGFGQFKPVSYKAGPAVGDYLRTVPRRARTGMVWLRQRLSLRLYAKHVLPVFEPTGD